MSADIIPALAAPIARRESALVDLLGELDVDPHLLAQRIQDDEREAPSVAEAYADFLQVLAVGKTARTVITYRVAGNRFLRFLQSTGIDTATLPTLSLPPDAVERFVVSLAAEHGPGSALNTYLSAVKSFYRYLGARRVLPRGVTYELLCLRLNEIVGRVRYQTRRIDRRLPLVVGAVLQAETPAITTGTRARMTSPAERELWLLRDRALILTLWSTGARVAEVVGLNRDDIDDGQALIIGKGGRERFIFFDQPTLGAIAAYLAARGDRWRPLFLRHNRVVVLDNDITGDSLRLQPQSAWLRVRAWGAQQGIDCSPHHFRHLKALTMLKRGARMSEIQAVLGHDDLATTSKIYARYDVAATREAFDRFSMPLADALRAVAEQGKAS